jgi:hypothetical protein
MAGAAHDRVLVSAVEDLAARLAGAGLAGAGEELRRGVGLLNGPTDGWALLLESIERVDRAYGRRMAPEDRKALASLRANVRALLHRR